MLPKRLIAPRTSVAPALCGARFSLRVSASRKLKRAVLPNRIIALTLFAALAFAPQARGQWVQTNGPCGAFVSCFAVVDTNLFCGTATHGVFLSTNFGSSWKAVNSGLIDTHIETLATIGTNLFAGTGGSGIYVSTDNGKSWTPTNTGLPNNAKFVHTLTVNGSSIVVGTQCDGPLLSTNNGADWTEINAGLTDPNIAAFAVEGSNLFAAIGNGCQSFAGPRGIFRSTDSGKSWAAVNNGLNSKTDYDVRAFAVSGTFLLAATSGGRVFRSTDDGVNWILPDSGSLNAQVYSFTIMGANLFAGSNSGVFLSTNNGTNWRAVSVGLPTTAVTSFGVIGTNLFAGMSGDGVFISTDSGTSWVAVNTGFIDTRVTTLATDGVNLLAGTRYRGNFLSQSSDSGTSWQEVHSGLNAAPFVITAYGVNLLSGTSIGVYLSTNHGMNWNKIFSPGSGPNSRLYAFAVSGVDILAGTDQGVFLSSDTGKSWSAVLSGKVHALQAFGSNLYAGMDGNENQLYFSTDNGLNWAEDTNGIEYNWINTLAASSTNLFVGTSAGSHGGAFLSTNNGESWSVASKGLPYNSVYNTYNPVLAFAASGSNIFTLISTAYESPPGGIFLSTNNGTSWTSVDSGLNNIPVNVIAVDGTNLLVGTEGSGVWRRPLSEMIGQSAVAKPPAPKLALRSYPNPFSQSTKISFTPEVSGYADVSVVNLLGVEVARIFSGELVAGEHTFTWDAASETHAPQGVYECLIRMNGRVETLPVMVLR